MNVKKLALIGGAGLLLLALLRARGASADNSLPSGTPTGAEAVSAPMAVIIHDSPVPVVMATYYGSGLRLPTPEELANPSKFDSSGKPLPGNTAYWGAYLTAHSGYIEPNTGTGALTGQVVGGYGFY